ncbi:hypothetical protein JYB87_13220 [Shewanella avicenniae]|uniref:Membrane anchored protein in chemotaxis locus n=1 Tax=Shewanella avicenniae TaxID=2814294 RepID=A0ABX7QMN1_9GAMM|nr:hypothetical protein [Shewanella avicenniae]QSX32702.1 hypothetical protein JYB87_13220 [Shewanella avicenniae]
MANGVNTTAYRLIIFLLVVVLMSFATATWHFYDLSQKLKTRVDELASSQVMLMVPKEQAGVIANWMQQHPEQIASLLDVVNPVSQGKMTEQQALEKENNKVSEQKEPTNTSPVAPKPLPTEPLKQDTDSKPVAAKVELTSKGVKVVPLEHGGIIITTRKVDD